MYVFKNRTICNTCSCFWRPHDARTIINCDGRGINVMPKISDLSEVYAANNNIEEIGVEDLADTLTVLDLQYNKLKNFDEATTLSLFSSQNRSIKLAGNPLLCNCDSKFLVENLHWHKGQIPDFNNLTCVDGTLIKNIDPTALCFTQSLIIVIISILSILIFLSTGTYLVWTKFSREIKAFLYSHGWRFCIKEDDDYIKKEYDVFISFAQEDETFVMEELLPKLENESLVVCVHHRDWCAGDWIPAQIAKSVASSSMTLVVLSSHFLKSSWALLEFRTAHVQSLHDGRARLAVLLVEDVLNYPQLDPELKAYLATTTYVRWNEPLYWEKLMYALPQPNVTRSRHSRDSGHEVVSLIKPNDPCVRGLKNGPATITVTEILK